jgi:ribonuclease D
VRGKAEELGIEPELIASQKDLRRAAAGGNGLRALSGWRSELVGEPLQALLGKRPQPSTAETSRS